MQVLIREGLNISPIIKGLIIASIIFRILATSSLRIKKSSLDYIASLPDSKSSLIYKNLNKRLDY